MPFAVITAVLTFALSSPQGGHAGLLAPQLEPRLSLGQPLQIGPLAVVPIESTVPLARDKYLTLLEASKLGVIQIIEMPGSAEVNSLEVRNRGNLPVLLFAGELLLGGQQDRIVAKDSIVPAHERRDVPVFCVEHGRWDGKPEFYPSDTIVPDRVRAAAVHQQSQMMVWNNVAESNAKVAAAPATGTLRGTLDSPAVRAGSERLFGQLKGQFRPTPRTIGVICLVGGKIESADIFANANLFAANRTKLFRSYSLDVQLASSKASVPVDMRACQTFLGQIVSARRHNEGPSNGVNVFRLSSRAVDGLESGTGRFGGGFGGGGAMAGAANGFSHGTYKPSSGNISPVPQRQIPVPQNQPFRSGIIHRINPVMGGGLR